MVHVLAGSLGVSALVLASAELFHCTQVDRGRLPSLDWCPVQSAHRKAANALAAGQGTPPMGARRAFREGVLVEAPNPKTAAFFLAFVPQFVNPAEGSVAVQCVLLGSISVALNVDRFSSKSEIERFHEELVIVRCLLSLARITDSQTFTCLDPITATFGIARPCREKEMGHLMDDYPWTKIITSIQLREEPRR